MKTSRSVSIHYLLALCIAVFSPFADATETVRLGILKFGSVNWELAAMQSLGFDKQNGIELDITPLASQSATQIALKSGSVDVIVSDWFWVNLERSRGDLLQFIPYSSSVGSLMVPANSDIKTVADLKGKRIGIAGGPLSKGWLLLQAAAEQDGFTLADNSTTSYGAPPLLSQSLKRGQLDATLTYWHFAARLQASGLKPVLPLKDIQRSLGLHSDIPMLGYVFRQTWAQKHPKAVAGLANAITATKQALAENPKNWASIRPLMKAADQKEFDYLRQGYIDGIPTEPSSQHLKDAAQFYSLMQSASPEYQNSTFDAHSFWKADER